MRFDFFLLADDAVAEVVERQGGRKLNISGGGVTHVRATAFPFPLPSLATVVRFFLDREDVASEHNIEIRLVGPDGSLLLTVGHHVRIGEDLASAHPDEDPSLFVVGNIKPLLLPAEGRYTFQLTLDGDVVDTKGLAAITVPPSTDDEAAADPSPTDILNA